MTSPQQPPSQPIQYPNQPGQQPITDGAPADLPPPLTEDGPDQASPATQDPTGQRDIPIET